MKCWFKRKRDMAWWSFLYRARRERGMSFGRSSAEVPRKYTELGPRATLTREMG